MAKTSFLRTTFYQPSVNLFTHFVAAGGVCTHKLMFVRPSVHSLLDKQTVSVHYHDKAV